MRGKPRIGEQLGVQSRIVILIKGGGTCVASGELVAVSLLGLVACLASAMASAGGLLSYKYVIQQNCISSPDGFTDDFDIIGGGGPVPIIVTGGRHFAGPSDPGGNGNPAGRQSSSANL
jgi:hypothetical protein